MSLCLVIVALLASKGVSQKSVKGHLSLYLQAYRKNLLRVTISLSAISGWRPRTRNTRQGSRWTAYAMLGAKPAQAMMGKFSHAHGCNNDSSQALAGGSGLLAATFSRLEKLVPLSAVGRQTAMFSIAMILSVSDAPFAHPELRRYSHPLPLFLTVQCHLLYRTYLVLGGRVGSRRLAPTLHVEGFRCSEILGPSTRHVYTRTHRVYACARLVGDLTDCACAIPGLRMRSRRAASVFQTEHGT